MKRLILILFAISLCISAFAQEPEKTNKNAVYFTFGCSPFLTANISYEHKVWEPGHDLFNQIWIKGNVGAWAFVLGGEGYNTAVTAQVLSAGKLVHWDMGLGISYFTLMDLSPVNILPAGNLGLRLQKKKNSPIFRFGIGFPEILYASLGYAF